MKGCYISKIVAKGENKEDSIIVFKSGLNIIRGRSNTGKTLIAKSIYYCFGGELPFDKLFGYNRIEITLKREFNYLNISRTFGENEVEVETNLEGYKSGRYKLKSNKSEIVSLNDVLLSLIGIKEPHQIIINNNLERNRLTWKLIKQIYYVDFRDISKEESVIEPEQKILKTRFLSSLYFLFTGEDFANLDEKTSNEIKKARKNAVQDYINKNLEFINNKANKLNNIKYENIDIEKEIQVLIDDLKFIEDNIVQKTKRSKEILKSVYSLENRKVECEITLSRYSSLKEQYISDIKRLSLIAEGDNVLKENKNDNYCPFCNSKVHLENQIGIIEPVNNEINRIINQLNDLSEVEEEIKLEKEQITKEIEVYTQKKNDIEILINKELQPQADKIKEKINSYKFYIEKEKEISIINDFTSLLKNDLKELNVKEKKDEIKYSPRDYFDDSFLNIINEYLNEIAKECCYTEFKEIKFDKKSFDIQIDGSTKASRNGKGYCSFLNSIVIVAFRKYFANFAKFDPGFVIIDSPLQGLDQGVVDTAPESMRTALFKYFAVHQDCGQMIILENIDYIPNINYESYGVNVITFTKKTDDGRYGFLDNIE